MTTLDAIASGLSQIFSWPGILIPVAGTLLAMIASFLPGLGQASIAILAMVLTLHWEPNYVMLLFGAITGGATFMGSITAILFNIPGSVSSTPALIEGYPLSRRGMTRTAIACAATASAVGSVFGVVVLMLVLPIAEPWILKFGPLEMLLISILGLLTIIIVPHHSPIRSAIMASFGLLVSLIGSDPLHGFARWNFGSDELGEGIGMVPMLLGVFTIAELIEWMRPSIQLPNKHPLLETERDTTLNGFLAVFRNIGLTLRSSVIGTLVGIVPGIGGTVAGFVAYGHAVQSNPKDVDTFGHGNIKGLIAPEAAVDAKDGGSLLPTLVLGLPGSEACVILLAVFSAHGLVPGTPMLTTNLALTYTLIFSLLFSNLLTSIVGVSVAPFLAKLNKVQIHQIALPCLLICIVSVIQINGRIADVYIMLFFGVLSYFWRANRWPRIPFVIAFVLGRMIEQNFELTVQLVTIGRVGLFQNGVSIALIFMIAITLGWSFVNQSARSMPRKDQEKGAGLSILALAASIVFLVTAINHRTDYSRFSIGIACLAFAVSLVHFVTFFGRERGQQKWAVLISDLQVFHAHKVGLNLIAWIISGTWLIGLGPAIGVGIGFVIFRSGMSIHKFIFLATACIALGFGLDWFIANTLNVTLPRGWLVEKSQYWIGME